MFNIVLGSFHGSESSFAEEFWYDPDSVYVLNGVNKVCGCEEGIIFSTLGSLEPSFSGSDKWSCNHSLDVVRSDALFTCFFAVFVVIGYWDDGFVAGNLKN